MSCFKLPCCRLKAYIVMTFGAENQSFQDKSDKTQPIRTKFGIRGHVKGKQRSGKFARDRPILGKMGLGRVPRSASFFVWYTRRPFGNFATANFHQIWSQNVFRYPVVESGKTFSKIFTLGVISLPPKKNLKSIIGQQAPHSCYRSQDALQKDTVYSTL